MLNRPNFPKEALAEIEKIKSVYLATVKFVRAGVPTINPEILAVREATCRACPEWDAAALNNTGRCRKCGCSTWAKLRMATEKCPLDKWGPVNTSTPEQQQPSTD